MILKLYKKNITVKHNEYPEDLHNVSVSYEYELGTNNFKPVLYINDRIYIGDNLKISLSDFNSELHLRVELYDGNNTLLRTYTGTYTLYKMCTVGTQSHVDVYKENVQLRKRIKELEEKGDVV